MTQEEIVEMYSSLANGEKWERKELDTILNDWSDWSDWREFTVKDGIDFSKYEYRKARKNFVKRNYMNRMEIYYMYPNQKEEYVDGILFFGTKEECQNFIKNNKCWLENLEDKFLLINEISLADTRNIVKETANKLIEEINNLDETWECGKVIKKEAVFEILRNMLGEESNER